MAHHYTVLETQILGKNLEQQLWKLRKLTNRSTYLNFHRNNHLHSPRTPHLSLVTMSSLASPQDSNSNPTKTVRAEIKGRVQGVYYRNWTIENAKELGLKGWVRNRRDGSVEALFSGRPDKVQEMEQRCRRGPPDAMVTRFEVFPSDEDPGTGFDRRSTV